MSDDSQFINVVFDPTFQNFEHELQTMSLDKMMSIQYSEEVLQKNFTVIITILKQLHRGQLDLAVGVKDNKDWIQVYTLEDKRNFVRSPTSKDLKINLMVSMKNLKVSHNHRFSGKNKELQDQIDALRAK